MQEIWLLFGFITLVWAAVSAPYAVALCRVWREPMLRQPVLVIESDDWGAGPLEQAVSLLRLREILGAVRDERGHPAVMTLGLVLAIADAQAMRCGKDGSYRRRDLAAPEHATILTAIRGGIDMHVFAPQLHGLEHYWPAALMRAAQADRNVREWLVAAEQYTEALPDALQSRWVDAAELPSQSLNSAETTEAVREEAALFEGIFQASPRVAVPNTFVWTEDTERAWSAVGVLYVVTPGTRYHGRDAAGRLAGDGKILRNGQQSGDIAYLVRDVYFEPVRGHAPESALAQIQARAALGRPALVESHRYNYLGAAAPASFAALSSLLRLVRERVPGVRFLTTESLGMAMSSNDPELIERRIAVRLEVWVRRALALPRFGKLARLTGLAALLHGARMLAFAVSGQRTPHPLTADRKARHRD
jgi:hypothetical protein